MTKVLGRALILSSLLMLAGCASRQDPVANGAPVVSTNAAVFDPTTGNVPLPNILATAEAADPLTGRAAATPMTPPEALAYINLHEVGGTNAVAGVNAPIYLQFTYPVDPTTVTAANIKVFQITPDAAGTENNPLGFTDVTGLFSFDYAKGGTDLWLFPNFPLTPGTRYLYVVTDRVLDAATEAPIIPSVYFQYLQSPTLPAGVAAPLDPIWANVTSGGNILLSGYGKVMGDLIAASSTTTIKARTDIALMGRFITSGAGFISATPTGPLLPVEAALRAFAAGGLPGGLPGKTWTNSIAVTTTFTQTNANPALTVGAYWSGVTGLPASTVPATIGTVVLGTINSAFLALDPVVVAANSASMDLTAVTGAYDDPAGVVQPFRVSGNLVGYYNVATTIPFVYVAPAAAAPAGGYPLVIYQHGITSQKETVMLLSQALTGAGFAAVAIDLPMHGALALNPTRTSTQWGQDFMAVGAPLATRSNIQQGAFDLDRLEFTVEAGGFAALGAVAPAMTHIEFAGISLGSIVGAYYLAGNTTLATSGLPYTQTTLDADMKGFLSVPGGRLAYLIQNSPAFSATVNAGLAADGINAGTPTYNEFFQVTQTVVDTADPATMTTPLAAGLPSRLSGRLLMQEATSTTFSGGVATNGDQVIPNAYSRYFGNALGGEAVLGTPAAAAVAPGFSQLGYGSADRIPAPFMFTLSGANPVPKEAPAALSATATSPTEGYFQFDQAGIEHGGLLDLLNQPANAALMQKQMIYFLGATGTSIAIDPTAF
jgi:hypothetical protein